MRLAAEAAARVAELVNDDDEVTVIGFDTEPIDLIGPFAGRDRAANLPKILKIAPGGGGIYVYESLLEAQRVAVASDKLSRFVILLADGSDSERQEGARDLVRKMNGEQNTTLTVVSIGDGSDVPFLKQLAIAGKGRFHLTDKAANLPTIFTEEAALAQRNYIVENPVLPKLGVDSPILSGIAAVPQILGYVASSAKPAAQVILKASDSDPLLAVWQYGLGRAVAYTSDATGRWGRQWVDWQQFPKFWAQVVRWTILERSAGGIQASVTPRGDQVVIGADVSETLDDGTLRLMATLIDAAGQSREITLAQTGPGRFEAETALDQPGAYFVRVRPVAPAAGAALAETTIAYIKPYSPEYAEGANGETALRDWADLGGGALLSEPRQAFDQTAPVAASRLDLFPWLLALAALTFPLDIALRRITISLRALFGRAALAAVTPSAAAPSVKPNAPPIRPVAPVTLRPERAAGSVIRPAPPGAPASDTPTPRRPPTGAPSTEGTAPGAASPGSTAGELLKRKRQR